jgi:NAD/NADP transhydrogenase beta subunit
MENYQEALGAIVLMAGVVAVVFIIAKYTYLIKKAMIEKGLVAQTPSKKLQYIDIGCILGALGFGLIIATTFTSLNLTEDTTDLLVWGTVLICGALGLFLAHYLRRKSGDN